MTELPQSLISDTIRLLKENFDKETCWFVKKENVTPIKTEIVKVVLPPAAAAVAPPPTTPLIFPKKKNPTETTPPLKKENEHIFKVPEKAAEKPLPFDELSKKVTTSFPGFIIKKDPLDDKATYLSAVQAESLVLSFREGKESDLFLKNLQKTLENHHKTAYFFDATIPLSVEELKGFCEQLQAKLVIASPAILKSGAFLPFLKEIPASTEWFLGNSRLHILEPITAYFTNPQKKKTLWQTLCAILKSRNTQASS